jgi:hypothetical protein
VGASDLRHAPGRAHHRRDDHDQLFIAERDRDAWQQASCDGGPPVAPPDQQRQRRHDEHDRPDAGEDVLPDTGLADSCRSACPLVIAVALNVSEKPVTIGDEVADHQAITRGGRVEAVVVPLEEYRALKALEQRETELYWAIHETRYPSRPGDDALDGKVYDSMDALLADPVRTSEVRPDARLSGGPSPPS